MIFTTDMIKPLITKIGWTQRELAEAVGASEQQMTKWMKGRGSSKMRPAHRNSFIQVCVAHCITEEDL